MTESEASVRTVPTIVCYCQNCGTRRTGDKRQASKVLLICGYRAMALTGVKCLLGGECGCGRRLVAIGDAVARGTVIAVAVVAPGVFCHVGLILKLLTRHDPLYLLV